MYQYDMKYTLFQNMFAYLSKTDNIKIVYYNLGLMVVAWKANQYKADVHHFCFMFFECGMSVLY